MAELLSGDCKNRSRMLSNTGLFEISLHQDAKRFRNRLRPALADER